MKLNKKMIMEYSSAHEKLRKRTTKSILVKEDKSLDPLSFEEEKESRIGIILLILAIHVVIIIPLIAYYIPTGQSGVFFYYLTNKTSLDWNEFEPTVEGISKVPLTPETNLTFIIHGFSESSHRPWIHRLAQAILSRENGHNIVLVIDYWDMHRAEYFWMRANRHYVSELIVDVLENLVQRKNLRLSQTHLIGFSMGGQICGLVGSRLKSGRLGKITALDPTFPLNWVDYSEALDASDAELVVVLKTSLISYLSPLGHVNFYVNGGKVQPGCDLWWYPQIAKLACSHMRAVYLALEAEQMSGTDVLPSCLCPDYTSFRNKSCPCEVIGHFDLATWKSPSGKFYLDTNRLPPYTIPLDTNV